MVRCTPSDELAIDGDRLFDAFAVRHVHRLAVRVEQLHPKPVLLVQTVPGDFKDHPDPERAVDVSGPRPSAARNPQLAFSNLRVVGEDQRRSYVHVTDSGRAYRGLSSSRS